MFVVLSAVGMIAVDNTVPVDVDCAHSSSLNSLEVVVVGYTLVIDIDFAEHIQD